MLALHPISVLLLALAAGGAPPGAPTLDWQQRRGWINVKEHGAKGDGVADDAPAINAVLRNMSSGSVLYLPPGTYRLTQTLVAGTWNMSAAPGLTQGWIGGQMLGHGQATELRWDGAVDGKMFWSHGVGYWRYEGLWWNGQRKAGIGVYHMSNTVYETEVLHVAPCPPAM